MDEIVKAEGYFENYVNEILRYEPLSREEEKRLIGEYKQGCFASGEIILKSNLRFVLFVGRQLSKSTSIPFPDLISEGNLGLIEALNRFDISRNVKFITYAVWWVRQSMIQAIQDKGRIVRLPVHHFAKYRKIKKFKKNPLLGRGEPPVFSEEEIEENARLMGGGATSLDKRAGKDGSLSFLEVLRWEGDSQEKEAIDRSRDDDIDLALERLSERDAQIIRKYFGLDGEESMTLEEIGDVYNLSKERIRQIKQSALNKMREKNKILMEYL